MHNVTDSKLKKDYVNKYVVVKQISIFLGFYALSYKTQDFFFSN